MREQVVVLPPSTDRRKASFNLGKKDEALINTSKDSRKWVASEHANGEKSRGFVLSSKDLKQAIEAESVAAEKMKKAGVRDSEEAMEASKQEVEGEKGVPCSVPLLQWGQRKRSRCSRMENHNSKPCNSADDSAVLYRKTVRVQADKALTKTAPLPSKGNLKAKSGVVTKKEHMYTKKEQMCASRVATTQAHPHQEEKRKQSKLVKNGIHDVRQERKGSPIAGSKRGCPASTHKQEKACTLPGPKSVSPETSVPKNGGGGEASPSKTELVWPKFLVSLSRREKEEDFLRMKGSKLPQRPRRRPKVAERAVHYCSPGTWLADISHVRYDVREKKRAKKKPRGLKGMESLDSDSE